jgi:hypothetical protein
MESSSERAVEIAPFHASGSLKGFVVSGRWPNSTKEWAQLLMVAVRVASVPGLLSTTTIFGAREELPDAPHPGTVGLVLAEGTVVGAGAIAPGASLLASGRNLPASRGVPNSAAGSANPAAGGTGSWSRLVFAGGNRILSGDSLFTQYHLAWDHRISWGGTVGPLRTTVAWWAGVQGVAGQTVARSFSEAPIAGTRTALADKLGITLGAISQHRIAQSPYRPSARAAAACWSLAINCRRVGWSICIGFW